MQLERSYGGQVRMSPPMSELCQYIPFNALRAEAIEASKYIKYLSPDFLEKIAEPCIVVEGS